MVAHWQRSRLLRLVPGSNPASPTVKNSEDRQSHCVYCKSRGREADLPLRPKKKKNI